MLKLFDKVVLLIMVVVIMCSLFSVFRLILIVFKWVEVMIDVMFVSVFISVKILMVSKWVLILESLVVFGLLLVV